MSGMSSKNEPRIINVSFRVTQKRNIFYRIEASACKTIKGRTV
jgi:hypothetical protein